MVRLDSKGKSLILDLKDEFARQMADMVLATVYLYATNDDETKARLTSISRMVKGELPLADIDLEEMRAND